VCTVPLPPGVNPIAVDKYISISIYIERVQTDSDVWVGTLARTVNRPEREADHSPPNDKIRNERSYTRIHHTPSQRAKPQVCPFNFHV